jgi:hypothetical protein
MSDAFAADRVDDRARSFGELAHSAALDVEGCRHAGSVVDLGPIHEAVQAIIESH